MDHKLPKYVHKLDSPLRKEWQDVDKFIIVLKPFEGMVYVDIGVGTGYFSIPVAERFKGAKIMGLDKSKEMLDYFLSRVKEKGLNNILAAVCLESCIPISDDYADRINIANVLHELSEPISLLKEAKRILKEDGRLILIDWKAIETEKGPPLHIRIEKEKAKQLLKEVGFKIIKLHNIYPYHYVIESSKEI